MTVTGIALSSYEPGALRKVPVHLNRRPQRSFDLACRLGEPLAEWVRDRYDDGDRVALDEIAHRIPMQVYGRLSMDELCKLRFGSTFMMDRSVEDAFDSEPRLRIYQKITNGMWRWGCGRAPWNDIVDAYEGIRRFDLGHPDFEARLDHSTSCNECGYSQHSRTFLDGVFGYLVHHRGEHVMTLGFTVMAGRRILIQQVQLKERRGNRWLFKLPRNYLEHVIGRFRESFPRHRLYVVDGGDVIGKSLSSYRSGLAEAERRQAEAAEGLRRGAPEHRDFHLRRMDSNAEEARRLRECIAHAEPEVDRLRAFYANTGRFRLGRELTVNRLRHYRVD